MVACIIIIIEFPVVSNLVAAQCNVVIDLKPL